MKKTFIVLLLFVTAGIIASVFMTQLHYRMAGAGFEEKSFCHVSDFFDCDTVLASHYAKIKTPLGNYLLSELGLLYYLLVVVGLFYTMISPERREGTFAFLLSSSFLAVLYSVAMATISLSQLGVLCLLCFVTYLVNLALLVFLPRLMGIRYTEIPRYIGRHLMPRIPFHLGMTLLVFGVGLAFFWGLNPAIHKVRAEVPKEVYLKAYFSQTPKETHVTQQPTWGNPSAKVTIVEFSDFQCPYCRRAAFTLKPYLKEFRKNVRFVFMNYPLDSACNPAIQHSMHPVSCMAAKAVICADKQGKFWDYHDQVFENQKRLSRDTLLRIAKKLNFDLSQFEQCLVSEETAERLKVDIEAGNLHEVRGTPAVYINGRPFPDWMNPERLRMVIEGELASSRQEGVTHDGVTNIDGGTSTPLPPKE